MKGTDMCAASIHGVCPIGTVELCRNEMEGLLSEER